MPVRSTKMAIESNKLPLMKNDPINMYVLILHFVPVHVTSQIQTRLIHPKQVLLNTASASKVGKFRPFLGEVKKLKGPLMSIFLFEYRNVEVQLLRQHWMHFVRDHLTCWMLQMRRYKSGPCR